AHFPYTTLFRSQPFREKLGEALARDDLDDAREHVEAADGAIRPPRAGLKIERNLAQAVDQADAHFLAPRVERLALRIADPAAHQARRVRQEVDDGDVPLGRHRVELG